MYEHLRSQWYLLLLGQAHFGRKKVLFFSRSLITTHKFNISQQHKYIFDCLTLQIDQRSAYMLSFYHYCLQPDPKGTFPWRGCIAYSLCLPAFMTRVLFLKAEEGLPTSDFQLPTSDFRTIQKLFFPLLLGRLCSRRFFLSRLFHIRAVYTRENMPRLTIAAAYIRRESNTPYKWYKIYAHG